MHKPVKELVLQLRPLADDQLEFLAGILSARKVPGLGQDPQVLSEVQRDLILLTMQGLDASRTSDFLLKHSSDPLSEAEATARIDLLGAVGKRAQLDEIFSIANKQWLPRDPKGEPATLKHAERIVLRQALVSILRRDTTSFDHIQQRWSGLHAELKIEVLLALGQCQNPRALDLLGTVLRDRGSLASAALGQIRKLGRHHLLSRNQHLRLLIRPYLTGSTAQASAACQALSTLGDMQAIPKLIELLGHEQRQLRDAAYWSLGKLTGQPFPSNAQRWQYWYSEELSWMRSEKSKTIQKLHANDPKLAARASTILSQHPLAFDELEDSIDKLLRHGHPRIQVLGIQLAAERNLLWSLPHLIKLFGSMDEEIAREALLAATRLTGLKANLDSEVWDDYLQSHSYLLTSG